MPKATGVKKRKAANGYKLAEPIPLGEILKDVSKKEWKLGPSIGQGGFGEIYSAKEAASKGSQYPYVIKIEPHANGPLFVEMHFYMRNSKPEDVEAFKKKKGLKTFGMPLYLGSGSHEYNGEKYRFIVMEKFGQDLWKIFLENNRIFPTSTVFKIAVQILDVLEYIHSKGYVHADIKAANILMGITKETQNKQCYLVDFGLATKYSEDKDFKPNPKKAHDGTIEYLSRDAHLGVQSRRGDLEILAYNIIQWLGCILPWEKKLTDPKIVQKSKEEHMSSVQNLIKSCFGKKSPPGVDSIEKPFQFSLPTKSPSKRTPSKSTIKNGKKKQVSVSESSDDEKEHSDEDKDMDVTVETPSKSPIKKVPPKRKNNDKQVSTPKIKNSRKKHVSVSESSEDEKEHSDEDEDMDVTVETPSKSPIKKVPPKRKNNDKQVSTPKIKNSRKKHVSVSESSEDEKEHSDEDMDVTVETPLKTPIKKVSPKRKNNDKPVSTPKIKNGKKKHVSVSESSEDEDMDVIVETPSNSLIKKVSPRRKNNNKPVSTPKIKNGRKIHVSASESSEDEKGHSDEDEDMDFTAEQNVSTRRKQKLNYTEDSDEEPEKSKKIKKAVATKRDNAKGDNLSLNGYTDAMKEVLLRKIEKDRTKGKNKKADPILNDMEGFTDSMKEVALKKMERLGKKKSK